MHTMKHRVLGSLGWNVSEIGFGSWAIGSNWGPQNDEDSVVAIHSALDLGCNFIDTARAYGDGRSERVIARVMKDRPKGSVYVATKVPPVLPGDWPPGPYDTIEQRYPEAHIRTMVEKSLRDLQTDCLDLIQIHTWSRAWNQNPTAFEALRTLQKDGKVKGIGISTPEHDQNAVIDLMRDGLVDTVQVIYNIFAQEAQEGIFAEALKHRIGVIVRVAFDESSLTGKLTESTQFPEGDIRGNYFAGDRLPRTVRRVKAIESSIAGAEPDIATAALKFALKPAAVSTVIAGIRNPWQAEKNCAVGRMEPMSDELEAKLRTHYWRRAFWHQGK
jgi:aryl-alcohol dehydrogenase-like predicted oxidoreductase